MLRLPVSPRVAAISVQQALQIAIQHQQAGRLSEARGLYERVLVADPCNADALHLLGLTAHHQGHRQEALDLIQKAISALPTSALLHNSFGWVLQEQQQIDEAIKAYRQAIAVDPGFALAFSNLGNALRWKGDFEDAFAAYHHALRVDPALVEAYANLGHLSQQLHKLPEAISAFRQVIALTPKQASAHNNLGIALLANGQVDEAISACRQAAQLQPNNALIHNNLGNALKEKNLWDEAFAAYQRAIQLNPEHSLALNNLANVYKDRGEIEEALEIFRRAVKIPDIPATIHSNYLAVLQYSAETTLASLADAHREYDKRHAEPLRAGWQKHTNIPEPNRVLRLGFVSLHFRFHPVGHFLVRLLENLDRQRFQIICYSDRPYADEMNARLRACAAEWQEVQADSDEQLAERIRGDRIDILFDLAGHTAGNRLLVFARKPAPIQITWLDYVGTTGLSAIDYILADPHEIPPEAEAGYREKVLRLPEDYICFDPPVMAPPVGPLPAIEKGYITFASFNIPAKTTPLTIETWSRVLHEIPTARLILKNQGFADPSVTARYRDLFAKQGVTAERISFQGWSPQSEILASYNEVDIALDTLPYNGGLTTCEALWMGVPVITCPGEIFASRHGLSHLHAAGFVDTIARDPDDYVKLAVELSCDLQKLAALRATLRLRVASSPLRDGPRFAGHFTKLIDDVWRQWCAEVQAQLW